MRTWSQRVKDIQEKGWSLTKIAKHIGLSLPAVSDIKTEQTTEPKGMAAVNLHALHKRLCGRDVNV